MYDDTFFRYIKEGATGSAQAVVPLVLGQSKISSILDVGCGAGAWLAEYHRRGVPACVGVDGDYVPRSSLLIPASAFVPLDITKTFDLGRQFDLVQCLEVGEHIPPGASEALVDNLVRHGKLVLFSAAIPGQGGENHVNERPYEFWRALFAVHGFRPYDSVRPSLRRQDSVEPWYRHNIILYVADGFRESLSDEVARTRIPDDAPIQDVSSIAYKLRTLVLAQLSVASLTVWRF